MVKECPPGTHEHVSWPQKKLIIALLLFGVILASRLKPLHITHYDFIYQLSTPTGPDLTRPGPTWSEQS